MRNRFYPLLHHRPWFRGPIQAGDSLITRLRHQGSLSADQRRTKALHDVAPPHCFSPLSRRCRRFRHRRNSGRFRRQAKLLPPGLRSFLPRAYDDFFAQVGMSIGAPASTALLFRFRGNRSLYQRGHSSEPRKSAHSNKRSGQPVRLFPGACARCLA